MILVLEPDPENYGKVKTRAILDRGELAPTSLLDVRLVLRNAERDLPGKIDCLTIITDRRKQT